MEIANDNQNKLNKHERELAQCDPNNEIEGATLGKPKGRLFGGLQADRQRGCGGRAPAYYYFGPRNPGRNKQKKLRVENDRDSSSTKTKSPHTTPPRRGNLMLLEQCCWFFRKDNYVVGKY
jgi:hypothetical protein